MKVIALLGSILLAVCSVPLAIEAVVEPRTAREMNPYFLHMWAAGEILTSIYIANQGYWILLLNYGVNLIGLAIVYTMRYTGRGEPPREVSDGNQRTK